MSQYTHIHQYWLTVCNLQVIIVHYFRYFLIVFSMPLLPVILTMFLFSCSSIIQKSIELKDTKEKKSWPRNTNSTSTTSALN